MALNFPISPEVDDTYTEGNTTWKWDGTAWNIVGNSAGSGQVGTTNAFGTIIVSGQSSVIADSAPDTLRIVAGAGMTITTDAAADEITFTSSGGGGNSFGKVDTDTGAQVVADQSNDTLNLHGGTNITTVGNADDDSIVFNLDSFSIDFLSDVDTTSSAPVTGNVLKWDGSKWAPGSDATTGGAGTDADTLDGFDSAYFLDYNNFTNTPAVLTLTDISVGPKNTASGTGNILYDNATGVFSFTPPDLTSFITAETNDLTAAVVWANVPDLNITESSVTQHQAALSITESQISDFGTYLSSTSSITALADVDTTSSAPTNDQVLAWNGSNWVPADPATGGGGGDVNQNAFSSIAVSGQDTIAADTTTDTLTINAGAGITIATNATTDTLTITNSQTPPADFTDLADVTTAGIDVSQIYEAAIVTLRVDNNGTTSYTFPSHYGTTDNPTIYALSGTTIAFDLTGITGHPFQIQNSTGTAYNTGLVHVAPDGTVSTGTNAQNQDSGVLYWRIPIATTSPPNYRYQCTSHAAMVGAITIKDFSLI